MSHSLKSKFCVKEFRRGPKIWGGIYLENWWMQRAETMILWSNPGSGINKYVYKKPPYCLDSDIAQKCHNDGYRIVTIDQLTDIYPEFVQKAQQYMILLMLRM